MTIARTALLLRLLLLLLLLLLLATVSLAAAAAGAALDEVPENRGLLARSSQLQVQGRVSEAAEVASQVLSTCGRRDDDCVDALQILAACHLHLGDLEQAQDSLAQALEYARGRQRADIWSNLGEVQRRRGRADQAVATLRKGLRELTSQQQENPQGSRLAQLVYNLGVALEDAQQYVDALEAYRAALERDPGHLDAAANAANLLHKAGQLEGGASLLATAAAAAAAHGRHLPCRLHARVALLWQQASRLSQAEAKYHAALRCLDSEAEGRALGPTDGPDGVASPDPDLELRGLATANIGAILQARGQLEQALVFYERAMDLPGVHAGLLSNAGACLWHLGHYDRARFFYNQSLRLDPTAFEARINLAASFYEEGDLQKAEEHYLYARSTRPTMVDARLALMSAPIMPAAAGFQALVQRSWEKLEAWTTKLMGSHAPSAHPSPLANPVSELEWLPFYWVYHGVNEYTRQGVVAGAYSEIAYVPPGPAHLAGGRREVSAPISVGFVSKFWHENHAHGQLLAGVLETLASDAQFEPWVLSLANVRGPASREVVEAVGGPERVLELSSDAAHTRERLDALALDVLVFADTMSEPMNHFLARERHALVQVAFWGNPVTSGSAQVDYFISGDALEPEASESPHYHEQVVRLRGLGIHYKDIAVPADVASALRLKPTCDAPPTFAVLQSAFKLHPAFEIALAAVLDRVPGSRVLLLEARRGAWTRQLQDRLATTLGMGAVQQRLVFVPRVATSDEYLRLLSRADIVLHPFPFGGSKTSADALRLGLPLVAMEGAFLRGRMATSFLRQMGMTELIARDASAYVEIASRLGLDCGGRKQISQRIASRAEGLFNDDRVLSEWKSFLARAARQAREELTWAEAEAALTARRQASIDANREGRLDEARQHLERLVELRPHESAVQSDYGAVLQQLGLQTRAIAHLRKAVELDPANLEARNNLAVTLHGCGMLAEAETHYRSALHLQPADSTAVCNLGNFYRDWNKTEQALALYLQHLGIPADRGRGLRVEAVQGILLAMTELPPGVSLQAAQELLGLPISALATTAHGTGGGGGAASIANNAAKLIDWANVDLDCGKMLCRISQTLSRHGLLAPSPLAEAELLGTARSRIVLLVQYFRPRGSGSEAEERNRELWDCLRRNIESKGVFDEVHLLVEAPVDLSGIRAQAKVKEVVIRKRLTFAGAIGYANEQLSGAICILANADIFFDESVKRLHQLLPRDAPAIGALLRWESSRAAHARYYLAPRVDSQDTWAFRAPLRVPKAGESLGFPLGQPRCDNRAARVFMDAGIAVHNFAVDVRTYHVHRSTERPRLEPVHGEGAFVPLALPLHCQGA